MARVSLRTIVMDVPPQDIITRDNVSVKVNAVVYFRVMDPRKAIVEVESYHYATSQLAQTTLRSVLGQVELDDLLSERERLNAQLQEILDRHTEPWGVKVASVEVKQVDLPPDMQRAMAKQAEAEREKRAKIVHAAGELEASAEARAGGHRDGGRADDDHAALPADADRNRLGKELDDHLSAADRVAEPAASTVTKAVSVSESTHDASADDGFHEIQLSGKQLVFLFMATTILAVAIFLCGVQVGRNVKGIGSRRSRRPTRSPRRRPRRRRRRPRRSPRPSSGRPPPSRRRRRRSPTTS